MPNPNMNAVHIDVPLSNIAIAFMQSSEGFIANQVFPVVQVSKKSDKFYKYKREDWNRVEMKPRAPGSESAGGEYNLDTDYFVCEEFGLHKDVNDAEVENADSLFNLQAEAAEWLAMQQMLFTEKKWFDTFFKTGVWGVDTTGTASLGGVLSSPTSTPIKGLKELIRNQQQITAGYKPNTLVIGAKVWDALQSNDDFLSRIIGGATISQPAEVSKQLLANMLGIGKILVSEAIINTSAQGAAESNSFVASDSMLLCYAAPKAGIKKPTAGYSFAWTGMGGVEGSAIKRFRMEHLESERVEINSSFVQKVIAPEMGTFIRPLV
jgi:hypothetical protein